MFNDVPKEFFTENLDNFCSTSHLWQLLFQTMEKEKQVPGHPNGNKISNIYIQGVPKQAEIFKSLIWDFLMIINYHSMFYLGEEDITFDIQVDLMTLFQSGIL